MVTERAVARLAAELERANHVRTDRLFAWLLVIEWSAVVVWQLLVGLPGLHGAVRESAWAILLINGLVISLPVSLAFGRPGAPLTRHAIAAGQMLVSSMLIHLTGGRGRDSSCQAGGSAYNR